MKNNVCLRAAGKALAALFAACLCLPLLAGCAGTAGETTGAAVTEPETSAAVTTAEPPEEITTEAVTEAPPVVTAEEIDLNGAVDRDIISFFEKAKNCGVAVSEDADGGKVIAITSKNIKKADQRAPSVFFNYDGFCRSLGQEPADLSEKTCFVIKLKAVDVHDRLFGVLGCSSASDNGAVGAEVTARVNGGDGWHYISFDFSGNKSAAEIKYFRLNFEALAGVNGESVLISEFRVCSAEEAAALLTPDVYPLQAEENVSLRVLQFNVQTENGNPAPFIVRAEMYRQLADRLMPDVIGMEEVTVNWRKWLDTYVFNDSYEGVGEPRTSGGEANPIYYRKDKFELLESGTFWLSDTPDKRGSSIEGANYPRICTWVLLRDKATGMKFAHMNTHLDHNGKNDSSVGNDIRKKQAAVIVKFAQRFEGIPVFLTGDMNCRRTTSSGNIYALYKLFTGSSTVKDDDGATYKLSLSDTRFDAAVTVDSEHTATMTKYYDEKNSAYNPSREPIDYVFYDPLYFSPLSYETFLISQNGAEISDHLPVFTKFSYCAADK